jgi:hypothetical protein
MKISIAFAVAVTAAVFGMGIYVKSHPPEGSQKGILWLRRGLRVAAVSSTAILSLFIVMFYFPPVSPSLVWPLMLSAFAGNILNLVSLVYCLRELNGESLCAAFLVLLDQFLWILYAIRAMTVDF